MAEAQVNFNPTELIKRVEDTEKRLQTKDAEIQVYKMLISQLEEEVAQAKKHKAIQEKQVQDVDNIKAESEKTLTKAKSLIFERNKIIKNQELQIEAFVQQIDSLKEVVRITKDLLEIRNLEIKQLENKIDAIEGKAKAEKERYDLMRQKLEAMIRHNGELKREYETQLCLFSALRERYNERELAKGLVDELKSDMVEEKKKKEQENEKIQEKEETANAAVESENKAVADPPTDLNSLVDAKNKLENILTVLENDLSAKKVEEIPPVNSTPVTEQTKSDEKPEENKEKTEENSAVAEQVKNDEKPEENKEKIEENTGTLPSIFSAIKNTVGLGTDPPSEATPPPEQKQN